VAAAAPAPKEPQPPARPRLANRAPANRAAPPAGAAASAAPVVPGDLASAYQALEKGQLSDAERLYRQALAADPRNVDAMLGLASIHAQQNRGDAATQLYMRVLEIEPRNTYAQAGLLNIGGRADPAAAESRLKQLIAKEPSAYLYFTLGNLYAEQNQWAAAQGAYFQAFNMAPDNPDYAFNLAVGLENISQPKLALDYYRRALALAQTRGNAQFALAPVQSRIRNLETVLAERP
jgi:tetratricopeptide (TPR) repeat protein